MLCVLLPAQEVPSALEPHFGDTPGHLVKANTRSLPALSKCRA